MSSNTLTTLEVLRRQKGLTQRELGELLNPQQPQSRISIIESGGKVPHKLLNEIARVLEYSGDPETLQNEYQPTPA